MAAINYPEVALKVQKVVEDNGAPVVFIRRSETPVDSAKPWRTYETTLPNSDGTPGSELTGKAVRDEYTQEEIDDNLNIRHGDFKVYVSPKSVGDVDLKQFDAIELDGETFEIEEVETIKPAAVALLYILQVRR